MNSSKPLFEAAVIGAGASGMMAAVLLGRAGIKTLLIERRQRGGAKLLMSGGSHCNITHQAVFEKDYGTAQPKTIRNILRSFPVSQTIQFFETIGIDVVEGEGGKCFPSTNRAMSVLESFLRELEHLEVSLKLSALVQRIEKKGDHFRILGEGFEETAQNVILCTGGLSYPETGSDGLGFKLAISLGHKLVETFPALVPLASEDPDWQKLAGISLPCRLNFYQRGTKKVTLTEAVLFTHFGFSGPAILDLSRYWNAEKDNSKKRIEICFFPHYEETAFERELVAQTVRNSRVTVKNYLLRYLPERLSEILVLKSGIEAAATLAHLKKEERRALIQTLFHYTLPISGSLGYDKAEVTAGGVDLEEVDARTLESKLVPGLFFAGEILDCDGRLGGFNFQWAWSSAHAVASGIIHKIQPRS